MVGWRGIAELGTISGEVGWKRDGNKSIIITQRGRTDCRVDGSFACCLLRMFFDLQGQFSSIKQTKRQLQGFSATGPASTTCPTGLRLD